MSKKKPDTVRNALPAGLAARMLSGDIYQQKTTLKVSILLVLLVFSGAWLYYTSILIKDLEAHEEDEVRLFTRTIEYALSSSLDSDVTFFNEEVIKTNTQIPVIYEYQGQLDTKNITLPENLSLADKQAFIRKKMEDFRAIHPPMKFQNEFGDGYVYYDHSTRFKQLQYYPLVMLSGILLFGYLAYLAFSASRRAEQNRVWVGLAKETAHQLGTPLSGLKGWAEFFKTDPERYDPEIVEEVEKDIERLETITARFSNIGSVPTLTPEPVGEIIHTFTTYLKRRVSTKVKWEFSNELATGQTVPLNKYLFEWVIENLCKNAVDAMEGIGKLRLHLQAKDGQLLIDITDNGRGIPKNQWKKVFNPGFSTKKRGWGLGLTLAKRIIENYHSGKLVVLLSEPQKGTTFRISLPLQ